MATNSSNVSIRLSVRRSTSSPRRLVGYWVETGDLPECACGCGELIRPHHDHPDYRYQPCQALWLASQLVDEADRVGWRSEQRFFHLLFTCQPWSQGDFWCPLTLDDMRHRANGVLDDADGKLLRFVEGEEEDAMRLLAHRYQLLASDVYVSPRTMVPDWAWKQRGPHALRAIKDAMKQVGVMWPAES